LGISGYLFEFENLWFGLDSVFRVVSTRLLSVGGGGRRAHTSIFDSGARQVGRRSVWPWD